MEKYSRLSGWASEISFITIRATIMAFWPQRVNLSLMVYITPLVIYGLVGGHAHIQTKEPQQFQETRHATATH